ncbi:hypothetical protein ACOBR2_16690 [Telmatobacter bradus]|uniref:hypothetical protein n=1 Tax=Telmatobacter bradus TaxID=474953 RepID=UPI003B43C270
MHAWGQGSYAQPAQPLHPSWVLGWRLVTAGAMVVLLAAITLGGVAVGRSRHAAVARNSVTKQAAVVQVQAQSSAPVTAAVKTDTVKADAEDEDLLATVDSAVARQSPKAMEPLARLMDDDEMQ